MEFPFLCNSERCSKPQRHKSPGTPFFRDMSLCRPYAELCCLTLYAMGHLAVILGPVFGFHIGLWPGFCTVVTIWLTARSHNKIQNNTSIKIHNYSIDRAELDAEQNRHISARAQRCFLRTIRLIGTNSTKGTLQQTLKLHTERPRQIQPTKNNTHTASWEQDNRCCSIVIQICV